MAITLTKNEESKLPTPKAERKPSRFLEASRKVLGTSTEKAKEHFGTHAEVYKKAAKKAAYAAVGATIYAIAFSNPITATALVTAIAKGASVSLIKDWLYKDGRKSDGFFKNAMIGAVANFILTGVIPTAHAAESASTLFTTGGIVPEDVFGDANTIELQPDTLPTELDTVLPSDAPEVYEVIDVNTSHGLPEVPGARDAIVGTDANVVPNTIEIADGMQSDPLGTVETLRAEVGIASDVEVAQVEKIDLRVPPDNILQTPGAREVQIATTNETVPHTLTPAEERVAKLEGSRIEGDVGKLPSKDSKVLLYGLINSPEYNPNGGVPEPIPHPTVAAEAPIESAASPPLEAVRTMEPIPDEAPAAQVVTLPVAAEPPMMEVEPPSLPEEVVKVPVETHGVDDNMAKSYEASHSAGDIGAHINALQDATGGTTLTDAVGKLTDVVQAAGNPTINEILAFDPENPGNITGAKLEAMKKLFEMFNDEDTGDAMRAALDLSTGTSTEGGNISALKWLVSVGLKA